MKPRTQSSLALSADGARWMLLNASPDLRQQIIATPVLHPRGEKRQSPISTVFLTNGDVDHVTGLLTLREQQAFTVYGARAILDPLTGGVFGVLDQNLVSRVAVEIDQSVDAGLGFSITPFSVPGKVPLYMETADIEAQIGAESDTTIGLEIVCAGKRVYYIPGCARITPKLLARIEGADALFLDGTTFSDDEMPRLGLSKKTAWRMGHVAMGGETGSIAALAPSRLAKRIFIHINNTNPVLREDSDERAAVERAGWIVAEDGMEFLL